ncbi:MAG: amino acid-binding protein [Candidatus Micrarchaeota archaeon]
MWSRISELFIGFPAQRQVARKLIELGLRVSDEGRVCCGEVEVKEVSLAHACGVDRRVVSATVHSILSDRQLSRLFSGIQPAGALLKGIAHELGFGVVEIEANAKKPSIIASATTLLGKKRISIRQIYAKDPELFENPTLVIITQRPIPGSLLEQFSKIPGVKKVSIL